MPFTLTAVQCPTPVIPASLLDVSAGVPTTFTALVAAASGSGSLVLPVNQNSVRGDVIGRSGAGAYGVDWDSGPNSSTPGLNLSTTGALNVTVGTGCAMLDGPIQKTAAYTVPGITDNVARTYLWLNQAGVVTPVNNSLTPPAGIQLFVGSCVSAGGVITSFDQSGVLYFRGPHLIRQTADTSLPGDTPPAGLSFWTHGASSMWLWDGLAYWEISSGLPLVDTVIAAGVTRTIPAGKQLIAAELDVQGTLVVTGRLAIVAT